MGPTLSIEANTNSSKRLVIVMRKILEVIILLSYHWHIFAKFSSSQKFSYNVVKTSWLQKSKRNGLNLPVDQPNYKTLIKTASWQKIKEMDWLSKKMRTMLKVHSQKTQKKIGFGFSLDMNKKVLTRFITNQGNICKIVTRSKFYSLFNNDCFN